MNVAGRVAAIAGVVALAAPGTAAADENAMYDLTLGAAAVEPYANVQHGMDHPFGSLGYSEVTLGDWIRCEATGAGYWLGEHEEGALMEYAVPQRNKKGLLPVRNPTMDNEVRPQPSNSKWFDWSDAHPLLPASSAGPRWAATCAKDGSSGRATGATNAGPGPRAAGSTVSAARDHLTGRYAGTADSYAQDLAGMTGGTLDSVTAHLHIEAASGAREPLVTYRLTLTRAAATATDPQARVDSESVTLAGTRVPARQLEAQFDDQRRALAPLGNLVGVTVVGPAVTQSESWTYLVTSPAVLVSSAPGTLATGPSASGRSYLVRDSNVGLRVGTATFTARR